MAETYHIFDYHSVPLDLLITLTEGLGPNSRTGMKITGVKAPLDTILLARIYDDFQMYLWSWSEDAKTGKNKPESFADTLAGIKHEKELAGFETGEDFMRAREAIIKKAQKKKR